MLIFWIIISAFGVWQATEITHHSQAGTPWRYLAELLKKNKYTKIIGDGLSCPFCYSVWFGFLFVGSYAFMTYNLLLASLLTFVGGLAASRMANLLNDYTHDICRTPNLNENSGASQTEEFLKEYNKYADEQDNNSPF